MSGSRRARVLVLTSTFLRHQFVVNTVGQSLDVVGVWQEEKSFKPERYAISPEDHAVIASHFGERDRAEEGFFGPHRTLRIRGDAIHRLTASDALNDEVEVDRMTRLEPDVVVVFGTGLLGERIISRFKGRIINLHLGLSPYYRGAGTNFWPLVNHEPELVGATVHYLDAGIDTGPIIAHARPDMSAEDGPHDIGNKAITAAATVLVSAVKAHLEGRVTPVTQQAGGRLYLRKDFSAAAVRTQRQNFETGMIRKYLAHKAERDAPLHLISLTEPA